MLWFDEHSKPQRIGPSTAGAPLMEIARMGEDTVMRTNLARL